MATAVLDLELTDLPKQIAELHRYSAAYILFRYKSIPAGVITLPVEEGVLHLHKHAEQITALARNTVHKKMVHNYLGYAEPETATLPSATVAVCTRNRPDDLHRCLQGLMALPDDGQEILVVDNAPSDDASFRVVAAFPRVRYVREDTPGLNNARNRAFTEASKDVIAFIDDDATPDPGWLRGLLRNYTRERVLCVTGMTLPLELETDGQEAFERYNPFSKGFERKLFDPVADPLKTGHVGAGANMSFRRSAVKLVGGFDEALDAGTATQSGGDHEYFARILRAGYYIIYEPGAINWHRHRRTMEETKKAIYGYGVGVYAYWTKLFWFDREFSVIKFPIGWFWHDQCSALYRSIRKKPGHQPLELVLAELKGCLYGPRAYFKAKRKARKTKHS